ncbi:LytR family transcriptional regulator [Siminovitchia acidinfaciens]|uniref:Polyisoprenyl-teichoic acid--peptidoglycan teichoic acid transferase TagU n=1 Tax=Siminovitchia acidinfaciens TaxID=2321395 RepID=A0A429XZI8_9BACI|nr:LCP family protein [Siminovitchia acidinfaciens]RST74208.1 LytR family transcriptional regulator [Siminovitchia acidinfaciens]
MEQEHISPSPIKRKLGFKITLGVIFLLIVGAGVYGFSVYNSVTGTLKKTHEPLKRSETEQRVINLAVGDPISILLFGVDQREGDRGRPDSLILLTANPGDKSIKMVSIPRDTYTEIIGKGIKDKINHSYRYGGVDMSIKTIENFLDVPIDYYVEVNMDGFKDLVDAVGGVTVDNTLDFSDGGTDFPVGKLELNGEEALKYSRMRNLDPQGDLGRQKRQRKIIQAIIKEAAQIKTFTNYGSILQVIGKHVKTNLTFDDMKDIQSNYSNTRHNIEQIQINGSDKEEKGDYYYIVSEEERAKLSETLRKHLDIQ